MKAVRAEQGKLYRAFSTVYGWVQAMDYSRFDYTLDRIKSLEQEVEQLKKELRQVHDTGPADAHNDSTDGGKGSLPLL